jgi:hypothetical protein
MRDGGAGWQVFLAPVSRAGFQRAWEAQYGHLEPTLQRCKIQRENTHAEGYR